MRFILSIEWAPVFGVSLAATMGSLYLLLHANPGTKKKETPDSAHENREKRAMEINRRILRERIMLARFSGGYSSPLIKATRAFKKAIIALGGLSIRCQQWIFDGKQLEDSGRFIDYGIKEGSLLSLMQDFTVFTSIGPFQWPELNVARVLKSLVPGIVQSSVVNWASRTVVIQRPPLESKKIRVEWRCVSIHRWS
jgi:hypothetical protein